MKVKKVLKILIGVIIITLAGIFTYSKIDIVEEKEVVSSDEPNALNLDLNSDIVKNLYESLNLDLVNNNCLEQKCLLDDSYNYLYFNFEGKQKELNNQEILYLTFNSLDKKKVFLEEVNESGERILTMSKLDVENEISNLFGLYDFTDFDSTFIQSATCGIIDYVFTGESYELRIANCESYNEKGYTRLLSAKKIENSIELEIEAFKINKEKNKYRIIGYSDELITSMGEEENVDIDKIFNDYKFDSYTFSFELLGDNYYLDSIKKNDK